MTLRRVGLGIRCPAPQSMKYFVGWWANLSGPRLGIGAKKNGSAEGELT